MAKDKSTHGIEPFHPPAERSLIKVFKDRPLGARRESNVFGEVDRGALLEALDGLLDEQTRKSARSSIEKAISLVVESDVNGAFDVYQQSSQFRFGADRESACLYLIDELFLRYNESNEVADSRFALKRKSIADHNEVGVSYDSGAHLDEASMHLGRESGSVLTQKIDVIDAPIVASKYWSPRRVGRPAKNAAYDQELFDFIREVYGSYIKAGRGDEVRSFIFGNDEKLYAAITNYEKGDEKPRSFPSDIEMPNRTEKVQTRLAKAARDGLGSLSKPARRSVTGKLRRTEIKNQK